MRLLEMRGAKGYRSVVFKMYSPEVPFDLCTMLLYKLFILELIIFGWISVPYPRHRNNLFELSSLKRKLMFFLTLFENPRSKVL